MNELPLCRGLHVCESLIVEQGTKNVTLVNRFNLRRVDEFPSKPLRFVVFAVLTNGDGAYAADLVFTHLNSSTEIYRHPVELNFPSPLAELRFVFRLTECVFPLSGTYEVSLDIDEGSIAHTQLTIVSEV